jgi:hypothetical protein
LKHFAVFSAFAFFRQPAAAADEHELYAACAGFLLLRSAVALLRFQ